MEHDDPLRANHLQVAMNMFTGKRAVLIAESSDSDGAYWCYTPSESLISAWLFDDSGLTPLSPAEYATYCDLQRNSGDDPFMLYAFHISDDRKHVTFSSFICSRAGHGGHCLVGDDGVTLRHDPDGGGWIS